MQRIALILLLLSCVIPSAAQQPIVSNQQLFTTEDGLPQSLISGVVQDRDGFIWIGTQGGIARYDGRSFKTISKKQTTGAEFRSHVINSLSYNTNNHIGIYYQGGHVDDLDPVSFNVVPFTGGKKKLPLIKQPVISADRVDNLFSLAFRPKGAQGVTWTDPDTGEQILINTKNGKIHNDTIAGMARGREGNIILVTPSGVEISRNKGESFEYTPFRIPYDSTINLFKDMVVMPDNTLVMRYKNTLELINVAARSVSYVQTPAMQITDKRVAANMPNIDHQGRLYFQQSGCIYRLEHNGELICLWQNPLSVALNITACFIDRDDVLWVSPNAQGLFKVNLRANAFKSFSYEKGFFPDAMKLAGIPNSSLPSNWFANKYHYAFYSAYGPDSLLYVCYGQADSSDSKTNVFFRNGAKLQPLSFPSKRAGLRGICVSDKNEIWVGDIFNNGLWYWSNKNAQPLFSPFDTTTMTSIRTIADIKCSGRKIWISTHGAGLWVFEKDKITSGIRVQPEGIKLPDNLTDIYINPANPSQLWIGSRGDGLILFDEKKGIRRIFTTEDGLPNNTIYCIVPDKSGILWLSTNRGICRFNPKGFFSSYYVKSDGLAGNEFNRYHKFYFPDGRIAMGGLDGFSVFNPSFFNDGREAVTVPIKITGISVNNMIQGFNNPGSIIKQPFSELNSIDLPYNKNYLSIEFAAMQFNEPTKIQYRYMLKGADDTWHESGNNNIATYTQIRPGRYKLLMNATGPNGIWSNEIKELSITIRPPFWANWWAYSFYFLVILFLINLYIRYHKKRLKEQQQLAFKQKETERLKELDTIKDRFFSNITHEFRTPLTLILTPLEKLQQDKSVPPQVGNTLNTMSRNARKLSRLVNEFLDFSKLDKGQMKVNFSHGDFDEFIREVVQQFNTAAAEKEIELTYSSEGIRGIYLFDEEKWEKIITNLVSNALKFTNAGGIIHIILTAKENGLAEIKVSDSGIGISADHLPKVFERFYQVDDSDTRHYEGTGIGLALVKELVELMNGSITAESKPGKGSTFLITWPLAQVKTAAEKQATSTAITTGEQPAEHNNGHADKPLILVAEDNDELRQFLAEGFGDDWTVITAPDGLVAQEMILANMPDVVISDVMMPGKDGLELCKTVKQDRRTGHIGFMLLTSRAAHDVRLKGLETGADDYIVKPFHLDELKFRVFNLLQLQQKQREFLRMQALPEHPGPALPKVSDEFIRHLYELLDGHLDDQQLNVDFLARSLALSRSSLNRKLKNLLDISANDLIRRYRLQRATALLAAGNDITSTAYQTGFNTPSYFSQCFKEQYGITPSEYLASLNGA